MSKEDVSIRKVSKEERKLPTGAKILSKEVSTRVEEIENGYIIYKNTEYKYEVGSGKDTRTDWLHVTQRWYSKEDPITVEIKSTDKSLADIFKED